jgi:Zn-dependent peptidase ImmA (M78 family)
MIYKPNYKKAELAAHKLLQLNNIQELPVKVKKLSKKFPNLIIKSYSWFANKNKMTIEETCHFANSEDGCCYYQKSTNQYLILYNDKKQKRRIRWTIAHELGHFMLKHNEISMRSALGRSSLSEGEYEVFEKEANCFARELLAPPTVIIKLGKINIFDIQNICDMSIEAASNVIKFLNTGIEKGYGFTFNRNIAKLFSNFVNRTINRHYCDKCNQEFYHSNPKFCPCCKNEKIHKTLISFGGNDSMIYDGYKLDGMGRAIECPQCGNEEVILYEGEHCNVCGIMLINKCAPTHRTDETGWNYSQDSCHTILSGNARYCVNCGNESTFFQQDLLDDWRTVQKQKEKEKLPF